MPANISLNTHLRAEFDRLIGKLGRLPAEFDRKAKLKLLSEAAKPLEQQAKRNVRKANREVKRYKRVKSSGKAAKGQGVVVAVYRPGNLSRSISILKFSRSSAVFVGPRLGQRARGADGYYGHMLEYGTRYARASPFMQPAVDAKRAEVEKHIEAAVIRMIEQYKRRNNLI